MSNSDRTSAAGTGREITADTAVTLLECRYAARLGQWQFQDIFSPYWRLYYNRRAGKSVVCAGREYRLDGRAVWLIPERMAFGAHSARATDHLWLHFLLPAAYRRAASRPIRVPAGGTLRALLARLRRALVAGAPGAAHTALAVIHAILANLPPPPAASGRCPPALRAALDRLESATEAIPRGAELARAAGMSERTLRRHLLRGWGVAPREYLLQLRLRRAARALAETDRKLEDIAAENGFADRFHFSKAFRARIGLPPAAFRARTFVGAGPREEIGAGRATISAAGPARPGA